MPCLLHAAHTGAPHLLLDQLEPLHAPLNLLARICDVRLVLDLAARHPAQAHRQAGRQANRLTNVTSRQLWLHAGGAAAPREQRAAIPATCRPAPAFGRIDACSALRRSWAGAPCLNRVAQTLQLLDLVLELQPKRLGDRGSAATGCRAAAGAAVQWHRPAGRSAHGAWLATHLRLELLPRIVVCWVGGVILLLVLVKDLQALLHLF